MNPSIPACYCKQARADEHFALPLALNGMALTAITCCHAMPDIANSASTRIEKQQDHIGLCCGLNGWLWLARSTRQSFNGAILGADGGCPGHVKQATYRIVLDSHTPLWSLSGCSKSCTVLYCTVHSTYTHGPSNHQSRETRRVSGPICPKCSRLLPKHHPHWRGHGIRPPRWIAWALHLESHVMYQYPVH